MRFVLLLVVLLIQFLSLGQKIGSFTSVPPGPQQQHLMVPETHTFQLLWQSGMQLSDSSLLGNYLDFTAYVPVNGSSRNGIVTVSSESNPAELAIFQVFFSEKDSKWMLGKSSKVDFSGMGKVANFCSGGITPWGTVVVAEEVVHPGDLNADGYQDLGWLIEVDPISGKVLTQDSTGGGGKDKLWALGRTTHENICIANDRKTAYFGADHPTNGFLYKFVSTQAGNLKSGDLYVMRMANGSVDSSAGTWVQVPNQTQADRNNTHTLAASLGATNFNGIEDVEIGPDGFIYFTAKGPGRVYRFQQNHTNATLVTMQVYVANKPYAIQTDSALIMEPWGIGNDNLAFDGEGNLWVLQDGDRNHIWVVSPDHVPSGDNGIRLFATTPLGSEPTGINFTPDFQYMFISFQHPHSSNSLKVKDGVEHEFIFNTSTTVVIARKSALGQPIVIEGSSGEKGWMAHPNPAELEILFTPLTEIKSAVHIKIIDALGRVVKEQKFEKGQSALIEIKKIPSGTYTAQIQTRHSTSALRFVKK